MAAVEERCSKGIKTVLANTVRGVALAVWGTQPRDSMLIAEMSVSSSIGELVQAENATKRGLAPARFGANLRVCGLWVRSRSLAANHAGGPGYIHPNVCGQILVRGLRRLNWFTGHAIYKFTHKHTHIMHNITRLRLAYPLWCRGY
jgi:hypothetical protein